MANKRKTRSEKRRSRASPALVAAALAKGDQEELRDLLFRELKDSPPLRSLVRRAHSRYALRMAIVILNRHGVLEIPLKHGPSAISYMCKAMQSIPAMRKNCLSCSRTMLMGVLARCMSRLSCYSDVAMLTELNDLTREEYRVLLVASTLRYRVMPLRSAEPWQLAASHHALEDDERERLRVAIQNMSVLCSEDMRKVEAVIVAATAMVRKLLSQVGVIAAVEEAIAGPACANPRQDKVYMVGSGMQIEAKQHPVGVLIVPIIQALMAEWPDLPYSVLDIASVAHITPNYFSNLFHQHTGKRFLDYLSDCRFQRACRLLRSTTLSIHEVARRVGFNDNVHFHRRFKAHTGMTPAAWRNASS
jgi:AraC-like DNA-binding protein